MAFGVCAPLIVGYLIAKALPWARLRVLVSTSESPAHGPALLYARLMPLDEKPYEGDENEPLPGPPPPPERPRGPSLGDLWIALGLALILFLVLLKKPELRGPVLVPAFILGVAYIVFRYPAMCASLVGAVVGGIVSAIFGGDDE